MTGLSRQWDAATEARRLENLRQARMLIRSSRGHQVPVDYSPGQVWYNFAEYPGETLSPPTEEDERNFAMYRQRGIELIHIHEEWNDAVEIYGADKFSPNNPQAYGEFIDLMHQHGLKIIPYFSGGYYDIRARNYDPRWAVSFGGQPLVLEGKRRWYRYGVSSPASPSWRAFLLNNIERMFDSYPIDGLYNDVAYQTLALADAPSPDKGHVQDAFEEAAEADGSLEDLMQEIHTIIRRHGGVSIVHLGKYYRQGEADGGEPYRPKLKTYDYTWVGERVGDLGQMRFRVKDLPPYVMHIPDWSAIPQDQRSRMYALSVPYLQFPVLYHGRAVRGKVYTERKLRYDPATGQCEACLPGLVGEYYLQHPDATPTYSQWYGPAPGDPTIEQDYWHYLAIYREMTKPGTHVFVDLQDHSLLAGAAWPDLVLSAFVNDRFFLAAANYDASERTLALDRPWTDVETGKVGRDWPLKPMQLRILERRNETASK